MRRSVLEGSAIGTLLSLRCGVMNRQLAQAMPLTFQEAFDTVLDKAEHGEPLCQMIIGNVYFWGDFVEVQGKSREDFDSDDAFRAICGRTMPSARTGCGGPIATASPWQASTWPIFIETGSRG